MIVVPVDILPDRVPDKLIGKIPDQLLGRIVRGYTGETCEAGL
jgi:hypothetical protein